MRNISFMLTQQQILDRTKTVTRRTGWAKLKAGDMLRGVEKGMGLKAGEKVKPLATIRVVNVRPEPLSTMTADVDYGLEECAKEGFGDHPSLRRPSEFVKFFCGSHRSCTPDTVITRIEFEYVD
ncbi:hypothetical protein VSR34_37655 [Paraburkholderia sp. JHI2823]|uniref:hypothetical protein n=1 Tax=Paraburkholderia sp. JHI2823 TaxID=3112960 RepID=UPI00316C0971